MEWSERARECLDTTGIAECDGMNGQHETVARYNKDLCGMENPYVCNYRSSFNESTHVHVRKHEGNDSPSPQTKKQNHCSVERKQGFAKNEKGASGDSFLFDFRI